MSEWANSKNVDGNFVFYDENGSVIRVAASEDGSDVSSLSEREDSMSIDEEAEDKDVTVGTVGQTQNETDAQPDYATDVDPLVEDADQDQDDEEMLDVGPDPGANQQGNVQEQGEVLPDGIGEPEPIAVPAATPAAAVPQLEDTNLEDSVGENGGIGQQDNGNSSDSGSESEKITLSSKLPRTAHDLDVSDSQNRLRAQHSITRSIDSTSLSQSRASSSNLQLPFKKGIEPFNDVTGSLTLGKGPNLQLPSQLHSSDSQFQSSGDSHQTQSDISASRLPLIVIQPPLGATQQDESNRRNPSAPPNSFSTSLASSSSIPKDCVGSLFSQRSNQSSYLQVPPTSSARHSASRQNGIGFSSSSPTSTSSPSSQASASQVTASFKGHHALSIPTRLGGTRDEEMFDSDLEFRGNQVQRSKSSLASNFETSAYIPQIVVEGKVDSFRERTSYSKADGNVAKVRSGGPSLEMVALAEEKKVVERSKNGASSSVQKKKGIVKKAKASATVTSQLSAALSKPSISRSSLSNCRPMEVFPRRIVRGMNRMGLGLPALGWTSRETESTPSDLRIDLNLHQFMQSSADLLPSRVLGNGSASPELFGSTRSTSPEASSSTIQSFALKAESHQTSFEAFTSRSGVLSLSSFSTTAPLDFRRRAASGNRMLGDVSSGSSLMDQFMEYYEGKPEELDLKELVKEENEEKRSNISASNTSDRRLIKKRFNASAALSKLTQDLLNSNESSSPSSGSASGANSIPFPVARPQVGFRKLEALNIGKAIGKEKVGRSLDHLQEQLSETLDQSWIKEIESQIQAQSEEDFHFRPIQLLSLAWGVDSLLLKKRKGLIFDLEMGLGKTDLCFLMAIYVLKYFESMEEASRVEGKGKEKETQEEELGNGVLIVVTPSKLNDWTKEWNRRYRTQLTSHIHHGKDGGDVDFNQFDVIFTTNETLAATNKSHSLHRHKFAFLIIDECVTLKESTAISKARLNVSRRFTILMSGTPFNRVKEFSSGGKALVDTQSLHRLLRIEIPDVPSEDEVVSASYSLIKNYTFCAKTQDTLNGEVLIELPQARHFEILLPVSQETRVEVSKRMEKFGKQIKDSEHSFEEESFEEELFEDYSKTSISSSGSVANAKKTKKPSGEMLYVSSFLSEVAEKGAFIVSFVESQLKKKEKGIKIAIFIRIIDWINTIHKLLLDRGISSSVYHGNKTLSQRQAELNDFQDGKTRVILLGMQVGEVGINLNTANMVILKDPFFHGHKQRQAIGRAVRSGNKNKKVEVIRLVTRDTAESSAWEYSRGIMEDVDRYVATVRE